ncbi:hypothetical protein ABK040_000299 [Willaertia magna]
MKRGELYTVKKAEVYNLEEDYAFIVPETQLTNTSNNILTELFLTVANMKKEISGLVGNVKQLEKENKHLKGRVEKVEKENKHLKGRVEELEKENKDLKVQNKHLKGRVEEVEKENINLKDRVDKAEQREFMRRANTLKEVFKFLANKVSKVITTIITDASKPKWYRTMESYCNSNIVYELPISINCKDLWSNYKLLRENRNDFCHGELESLVNISEDEQKVIKWYYQQKENK